MKNKWYLRKHLVTAHGAPLKRSKNNNNQVSSNNNNNKLNSNSNGIEHPCDSAGPSEGGEVMNQGILVADWAVQQDNSYLLLVFP